MAVKLQDIEKEKKKVLEVMYIYDVPLNHINYD
jgi:hypothetical protein